MTIPDPERPVAPDEPPVPDDPDVPTDPEAPLDEPLLEVDPEQDYPHVEETDEERA
jgi:hypothetical protein